MRRGEDVGGMGLRTSTTVTSESICCPASTIVASGSWGPTTVASESLAFGRESLSGRSPFGGSGIPLAELSPANGVPIPAPPGFLGTGFPSGRDLESSMVPIQQRPVERQNAPIVPSRARVRALIVREVYMITPDQRTRSSYQLQSEELHRIVSRAGRQICLIRQVILGKRNVKHAIPAPTIRTISAPPLSCWQDASFCDGRKRMQYMPELQTRRDFNGRALSRGMSCPAIRSGRRGCTSGFDTTLQH